MSQNTPFLYKHSTKRREAEHNIDGYYSDKLDMWVVEDDCLEVPIILKHTNLSELVTKTFVDTERDDEDDRKLQLLPETTTKTAVNNESDDELSTNEFLIELVTKTEVNQEQDDEEYLI